MSLVPTHARRLAWLVAGLVAFVMSLGLHRSLVVCTGPHCESVIEWAHASGDCCTRSHPEASCAHARCSHSGCDGHEGEDGDRELLRPDTGCSDVPLSLPDGPAPERLAFGPPLAASVATVDWLPVALPVVYVVRMHAPATGPPRPAEALERRATTVLLI